MILRKNAVAALVAGVLVTAGAAAYADENPQAYPSRVVKIVMPFSPGGMGDTLARLVANALSKEWQQTVIVDNRPGASGMIGNREVADADPDGYTLLIGISQVVQAPSLYKKLPYDITTDFTPISQLAYANTIFAVAADSPVRSIDDYIRTAREQPGKLSFGSYGAGTSSHIYGEIFNKQNDIKAVHVAYKGAAPLLTDVLGGHISVTFSDLATSLPYVQSGKMKAYAVSGERRAPTVPDVPTFKELGYPTLSLTGWYAMLAPAGMQPEIAQKISQTVARVIKSPEVSDQLLSWGLTPIGSTGQELAEVIRTDLALWDSVIKETGISIE